jgi:L-lactate dehydrogenase (cytochrome)
MLRDRGLVSRLLERAWAVGCRTLVFTVDLAVTGVRHRDLRYGMLGSSARARLARAWQLMTHPRWVLDVAVRGKPHDFGNLRDIMPHSSDLDAYKAFIGSQFDPSVTWRDIGWLRSQWQGKILIKGVMTGEDALEAADAGADGVVVSNHGGRQLDGVPATIDQLPGVVAAASGRLEVYLDGGVRNGLDVVRAVALGARGVLIGRPWIFAVAACGEAGLRDLLAVMHREISVAMALMGVNRISELNPDCVEIR